MKRFISLFVSALICLVLSACSVTTQDLHDIIDILTKEKNNEVVLDNDKEEIIIREEENVNLKDLTEVHDFLKETITYFEEEDSFTAFYMQHPEENLISFTIENNYVSWDTMDLYARTNPEEFMQDYEEIKATIAEIVKTVRNLGFTGEFEFCINSSDNIKIFLFISYAESNEIDYSDIYVSHNVNDHYLVRIVGNTSVWSSSNSSYLTIGTITFYDPLTEIYGAFGHSVDGLDIYNSDVYETYVRELDFDEGTTLGGKKDKHQVISDIETNYNILLGDTFYNGECGVYGNYTNNGGWFNELYEVAWKHEVHTGPAILFSEVPNMNDDCIYLYEIEITNVTPEFFNFVIVDEFMVSNNVGIAQGMSGSPIVQDGRLVGALSGMLVTEQNIEFNGYGVYAEDMLKEAGIIF